MLITSLPLLFDETFGIDQKGSPAGRWLEQHYRVKPIGAAERASLKGQHSLFMAHPRAQPAELLVELDRWVRGGGHVLLLADPKLDWPSRRPLGDPLRPPLSFADTGLLKHWGLALDGPDPDGPSSVEVDGMSVGTDSPGKLRLDGKSACVLDAGGFIARCAIGRGKAVIVADADFLDVSDMPSRIERAHNLDFLGRELDVLAPRH
ncbi:MAG: hypothetical protein ABIR51_09420 [Sphingomicrobium sp.]